MKKSYPRIDETVYSKEISTGLRIYVIPKAGYQKKNAILSVGFGSINNCFKLAGSNIAQSIPEGVAHFLEHRLFEDENGSVLDRFASFGAQANAFTSFSQTAYLFSCTTLFNENLELLFDLVQKPYFDQMSVDKEIEIIRQEIMLYDDNAHWRILFNLLSALYHVHPVRNDISGSFESIAQITPEMLYCCYDHFYNHGNMSLFVTGDIDPHALFNHVEKITGSTVKKAAGRVKGIIPEEPESVHKKRIEEIKVVSQPQFALGFKDRIAKGTLNGSTLQRELAMEIVLEAIFGSSEKLYYDLYHEDLIGDDFRSEYNVEESFGYSMITGETGFPDELYLRVLEAIEVKQKEGVTEEQFNRYRKNLLGSFISQLNSLDFIMYNYPAYCFRGDDFLSIPEVLQEIKIEDCNALLRDNLDLSRHSLSLILPE